MNISSQDFLELEEITHIAKIPAIEGLANNVIKNKRYLHPRDISLRTVRRKRRFSEFF